MRRLFTKKRRPTKTTKKSCTNFPVYLRILRDFVMSRLSRATGRSPLTTRSFSMRRTTFAIAAPVLTLVFTSAAVSGRQLASRPAPDWIQRLERPERIATLKIDYIISKLELKPGQVVADLGAGPGVISLPMAKTVGPTGKVYAVDIDQAFIDHITMRVKEQGIG